MNVWTQPLRRYQVVRASAAAIFLYGFAGAATSPYQALIGIKELGLSDREYAVLALVASITNVVMSILMGALSDRYHSYRRPLIFVSAFGVLGYGMVFVMADKISFAIATVVPLALFHATNPMLFGAVRAHTSDLEPAEKNIINSLMRMMISLAWILVPGVVGLMLLGQSSMLGAYLIATVLAGACLLTIIFGLKPDHQAAPSAAAAAAPPPPSLQAIRQLLHPQILLRVLGVAMISQVLHVNAAVLPMILTGQAGGQADSVGMIVGMVAALEVIFMIVWARVTQTMPLLKALAISSALYLVYLTGVAFAGEVWQLWAVSVIAGVAAAGIISLPISYLLDLIRDQPGLSASLIAVNFFAGGALGAAWFALGTMIASYPGAAILSGASAVAGAALLLSLERKA